MPFAPHRPPTYAFPKAKAREKKELTPFFHQAIGVQPKGIPIFGLGQRIEELLEVRVVEEDAAAIIAPIEGVVNQTVSDRSRLSSHAANLRLSQSEGQRKKRTDTIFPEDENVSGQGIEGELSSHLLGQSVEAASQIDGLTGQPDAHGGREV